MRAVRLVQATIEAIVLAVVCLAPWVFGGVDTRFEAVLYASVGGVLVLWAARSLLESQFTWQSCPVALCLALVFLLGAAQTVSLSGPLLDLLSPTTGRLYERVLPVEREVLASGEVDRAAEAAGSTLSLYPAETRRELVRLLVVFLLFAAVRNNISPEGGLRRLSAAILINAAAMSLFGFVQFFRSPSYLLYWQFESFGQVFGPFVNRNHFAFHTNLAIGLGVGLLLSRGLRLHQAGAARGPRGGRPGRTRLVDGPPSLLQDPASLWMSSALGLMLAAVVFCLSRGGFVALSAGAALGAAFWWTRSRRSRRAASLGVALAVAVGLLGWFGYERIATRLGTLWSGEAFHDDRMALLVRSWSVARDYPVWGTGYGTFRFIEPLYLHDPGDVGSVYVHAHNEYLEALIEGGVLRLALTLLAIGLLFRLGWHALGHSRGSPAEGLVLGGLLAVSTAVVHSAFEFGVHLPAIAVLLAVVAAHISSLGAAPPSHAASGQVREQRPGRACSLSLWGLAPLAAAGATVLLAVILVRAGYSAHAAARLRESAERLSGSRETAAIERKIATLQAAARLRPSDAELQAALGETWLDLAAAPNGLSGRVSRGRSTSDPVATALWHFVRARDLCPILPVPHVRLGAHVHAFKHADPRSAYLDRAKLVAPADPQLWYVCGAYDLSEGRFEQAWSSWRRSLELSDRFLTHILEQSSQHLGPVELSEKVLPDRPGTLLAAAQYESPSAMNGVRQRHAGRAVYLRKALALLAGHAPLSAEDWALKAEIHGMLGESPQALEAYESALSQQPRQTGWRIAAARHLYAQGRLDQARQHLLAALAWDPRNPAARALLNDIARQRAEREIRAHQSGRSAGTPQQTSVP